MSNTTRRLATIVALDVAGYSARTEADEAKTTSEVAALRTVIEGIAGRHGGRVFNTAGDGFMLEFTSSLAAVEAALELAEICEPKVRVGVHLGDVVVQPNGDLLGHGVNIAARLMAQSSPGAALVSGAVRQSIRGPVAERLQSRGVLQLDKMAETIEAFGLFGTTASPLAQLRSAEPVLAVLPFDNLSDDKELQFFSDGVSEEILQVLANGSGLKVIGRTSAFQFRGPRKAEAARMLRATHVLDGAVRKAGAKLRVTAQLTEGMGGAAVWTERYDQDLTDIFAVQDDIAAKVAAALRGVLRPAPRDRQIDPHAYELYLKAYQERALMTHDGYAQAAVLLEQVVALAPEFSDAWALLGAMRAMLLPLDRDDMTSPEHNAALAATRRALSLDPNCAIAFGNLKLLNPAFGAYAERVGFAERAVALAPNSWLLSQIMGSALTEVGRCRDAFVHLSRAATLDPMNPMTATGVTALLEGFGRAEDANAYLDGVIKAQPPTLWTATAKVMLLFNASRLAEAAEYIGASALAGSELEQGLRLMLMLSTFPREQRASLFQAMLGPAPDRPLPLANCVMAARLECADVAFEQLFAALDTGRPIISAGVRTVHGSRTATLNAVFVRAEGGPFRADKRFAKFCARVGLVDYWRTSGHWPDCAGEVPYDFKGECEKAAREVAKV